MNGDQADHRALRADAFVRLYEGSHAHVAAYFGRHVACPRTAAGLTGRTYAEVWTGGGSSASSGGSAASRSLGVARSVLDRWRAGAPGEPWCADLPQVVMSDLEAVLRLAERVEAHARAAPAVADVALN